MTSGNGKKATKRMTGAMAAKRGIGDGLALSIPLMTGLFIAVNPFPYTTAIAETSFYLTLAVLLLLLFFKQTTFTLQTPLTIPFGLFAAWSLFGLLFALNKTNSIHDIYAHLLKYLFFFYVLVNFFNSRERFIYLLWTIIISSTVFGAWMMIHDYLILGRTVSTKLGLETFSEMPSNIVGIITVFALLLALFRLKEEENITAKIVLVICLCVLTFATLATQTRGTLIALIVSLLLSFLYNRKIVAVFSLLIILSVTLLPVKNILTIQALTSKVHGDSRVQIWRVYGEIVKDHPLTGIGFGMQTYYDEHLLARYDAKLPAEYQFANFNKKLPAEYQMPELTKAPHNLLIDTAVRLGLVGLFLFLYSIFAFIRMGIKADKTKKDAFIRDWAACLMVAFTAFFIQGFLENVLSGPPAIVLYMIFGMMTILWRLNREAPDPA